MRNVLFFLSILLTISSSIFAQSTHFDLEFKQSQFQIKQTPYTHNQESTSWITTNEKGFIYSEKLGEPAIPYYVVKVAIPYGANFSNVNVSYQTTVLSNNIIVEPTQLPSPLSVTEIPNRINANGAIYSSSDTYPSEIVKYTSTNFMNKYAYISLEVSPFLYNPASKKLELITNISVDVNYTRSARRSAGTDDGTFYNLMKSIVINSEDVQKESVQQTNSVRSPIDANDVKYLIITNNTLSASFEDIRDWKTKKGFPAEIITTEDIYTNYSGATEFEKIKTCIYDYYQNKGLQYVLLGGDVEVVPKAPVKVSAGGYEEEEMPADLYFACFDDQFDWNADGDEFYGEAGEDNTDLVADIFVARYPAKTSTDVEYFTNKLFNYEKTPATSDYAQKITMTGTELWNTTTMGSDADVRSNSIYVASVASLWSQHTLTRLFDTDNNIGVTGTACTNLYINQAINEGQNYLHMATHGLPTSWSADAGNYAFNTALGLTNTTKPINVQTIACLTNAFDQAITSLSEGFMRSQGGAVSYYGSSRYGWGNGQAGGDYGVSFAMNRDFYLTLFNSEAEGGSAETQYRYGPIVVASKSSYLSASNGAYRWLTFGLNPMGDPSMDFHTEDPTAFTNITVDPINIGNTDPITVHTGVANALVCLMKGDEVYLYGFANASGDFTCTPTPTSPGNIDLTVSAHNKIAFESSVTVGGSGTWPTTDFTANTTDIFEGETIVFEDLTGNSPNAWEWVITPNVGITYVNSTSNLSQHPEVQFDNAGTYTVELTATNADGSITESKNSYITVNTHLPIVNFSGTPTNIIIGDNVTFTHTSENGPFTDVQWTFDGGTPASSTNNSEVVTYNQAGMYAVKLVLTNSYGTDSLVKVNYINVEEESICIGTTNGTNGLTSVFIKELYFSNIANNIDTFNLTHAGISNSYWAANGTYYYKDADSLAYSDYSNLVATAKHDTTYNLEVKHTGASSMFSVKYLGVWIDWNQDNDFDDAGEFYSTDVTSNDNVILPITVPNTAPFGNTKMRVRFSSLGLSQDDYCSTIPLGETEDYTLYVTYGGPYAEFENHTPTQIMEGEYVQFKNLSLNNPTSIEWTFENGTGTPQTVNDIEMPTIQYNVAGVYPVSLKAIYDNGSEDTETKTDYVTVLAANNPPVVSFTSNTQTIMEGGSVTFSNQTLNFDNLLWYFEGGNIANSTDENVVVTYDTPGTYNVALVATNAYGQDSLMQLDYITVDEGIYCDVYFQTNTAFLVNDFALTDGTNDLISNLGTWADNQGPEYHYSDYTDMIGNVAQNSSYIINISTNGASAFNTLYTSVWVDWNGDFDFDDTDEQIFQGSSNSNSLSFNFTVPANTILGNTRMRVVTSGSNPVLACGAQLQGEAEDYTLAINDGTNAAPVADFEVDQTSICPNESIALTDLSINNPTQWNWEITGPITLTSTDQTPSFTLTEAGYYNITLIATNANGSDTLTLDSIVLVQTCTDIKEINTSYLNVYPNPTDDFVMIYTDMKINEIMIFNSVGQLVKQAKNIREKIDLSVLSPGVYSVVLNTDHGIKRNIIIKE